MAGKYSVGKDDFDAFLRHVQLPGGRGDPKLLGSEGVTKTFLSTDFEIMWHPYLDKISTTDRWWQLTRYRYCSDIRDRIYAILSLKYEYGLRIDYSINPFELFLESLWLGQSASPTKATTSSIEAKTARELANMLEITPASVIMYTRKSWELPENQVARTTKFHRRAAASDSDRSKWLTALAELPGSHTFNDHDHWVGAQLLPHALHDKYRINLFPSWLPPPVCLESAQDSPADDHGFRLLITATPELTRQRQEDTDIDDSCREQEREDLQFLNRKCSWSLVCGVYNTKCADEPRRVYYMLVDHSYQDAQRGPDLQGNG